MAFPTSKRAIYDYFVALANEHLGLAAWDFTYSPDEAESTTGSSFLADADITINDEADAATLRLGQHLLTEKPEGEYIRRVLVHEALHCHRARSAAMVRLDLEDFLGKPADIVFWRNYARAREREIEAVARVLAPHLPLPPWEAPAPPRRKR